MEWDIFEVNLSMWCHKYDASCSTLNRQSINFAWIELNPSTQCKSPNRPWLINWTKLTQQDLAISNTFQYIKNTSIVSQYQCRQSVASKSRYLINKFMWRHLNPNDRPQLTPLGTTVDVMLHWNWQASETKTNCWKARIKMLT